MMNASAFDQVAYIIHDGERIGKTENFVVPLKATSMGRHDIWSTLVFPVRLTETDRPLGTPYRVYV